MDSSDIRIDVTLRLETALSQSQTQQVLRNLSVVDGIDTLRIADDAPNGLLRIGFDPYRISARDILKWFAQQTIKAELLAPLSQEPPANPRPTLQPIR